VRDLEWGWDVPLEIELGCWVKRGVKDRLEAPWGGNGVAVGRDATKELFLRSRAPCCGQFALEGSRRIYHPSGVSGKGMSDKALCLRSGVACSPRYG